MNVDKNAGILFIIRGVVHKLSLIVNHTWMDQRFIFIVVVVILIFGFQKIIVDENFGKLSVEIRNKTSCLNILQAFKQKQGQIKIKVQDVTCPSYDQLRFVPKSCENIEPKYFALYQSQIQPLFMLPVGRSGPMAQTHGYRDFILTSMMLRKNLGLSEFRKHYADSRSDEHIPFGIRFDAEKLCHLVSLKNQSEYLNTLLVFSNKKFSNNHTWKQHLKQGNDNSLSAHLTYMKLINGSTNFTLDLLMTKLINLSNHLTSTNRICIIIILTCEIGI